MISKIPPPSEPPIAWLYAWPDGTRQVKMWVDNNRGHATMTPLYARPYAAPPEGEVAEMCERLRDAEISGHGPLNTLLREAAALLAATARERDTARRERDAQSLSADMIAEERDAYERALRLAREALKAADAMRAVYDKRYYFGDVSGKVDAYDAARAAIGESK